MQTHVGPIATLIGTLLAQRRMWTVLSFSLLLPSRSVIWNNFGLIKIGKLVSLTYITLTHKVGSGGSIWQIRLEAGSQSKLLLSMFDRFNFVYLVDRWWHMIVYTGSNLGKSKRRPFLYGIWQQNVTTCQFFRPRHLAVDDAESWLMNVCMCPSHCYGRCCCQSLLLSPLEGS